MRLLFIFAGGILLLYLIALSDFYLSKIIRDRVRSLNTDSQKKAGANIISSGRIVSLSLLLWMIPMLPLQYDIKLEYKIIITIAYWFFISITLQWQLTKKFSQRLTRAALPYLLIPSFAGGLIIVPAITLITDM